MCMELVGVQATTKRIVGYSKEETEMYKEDVQPRQGLGPGLVTRCKKWKKQSED